MAGGTTWCWSQRIHFTLYTQFIFASEQRNKPNRHISESNFVSWDRSTHTTWEDEEEEEEEEEEEDINEEEEEEEDINEEEARSWYKFSELWVLLRTNYHVSHGMSHGIKAFIP